MNIQNMYSIVTKKRLQVFLIILSASSLFLDGLTASIINNILPVITESYSISITKSSWLIMGYFVIFIAFIIPFGKIADNGRIREVLFGGMCVFAIGQILCACSPNFTMLLVARLIQGLGAAMLGGAGPVIIARLLPPSIYGVGVGFGAASAGIATIIGPVTGGYIASFASWHWAFLVCVPFAAAGAIAALRIIPKPDEEVSKQKLDIMGTVLLFLMVVSFVLTLDNFPKYGITNVFVLGCALVFGVALLLFILNSLRCENPLFHIRIFTKKGFAALIFSYALLCVIYSGMMYIIPYYMQMILSLDASFSGLLLTIPAITGAAIAVPAGIWADKAGNRVPCIFAAVSYCILCLIFVFIRPEWGIPALVAGIVFVGISFGLMMGPFTSRIIQCAPEKERSEGATAAMFCGNLGFVTGVSVFTSAISLAVPSSASTALDQLSLGVFATAFNTAAVTGLVFAVAALILTIAVSSRVTR